ncbi:hypothetical protein CD134_09200 [Staphylococcus lutrae]|uniref:Uncharacterized protein n=1 Tax=Staphylococcus lutrae TaxID=155085 RepID=A0AAC9WIZ0_9STAP|nr:hypothetical protein B5P37_04725 [Staphylococcus lutrae]PNZ35616.1 hypothetical protein CD134_09200 [Staphylococcus lutrae]
MYACEKSCSEDDNDMSINEMVFESANIIKSIRIQILERKSYNKCIVNYYLEINTKKINID